MAKIPDGAGASNATSTKILLDQRRFVEWIASLSAKERRDFTLSLDHEKSDYREADSDRRMAAIVTCLIGRRLLMRALGLPANFDIEELKEQSERENAEAKHRTALALAYEGTLKAARRVQGKLAHLQSLEQARPQNQPQIRDHFNAMLEGAAPPSPVPSEAGRELRSVEDLIFLALKKLEGLERTMKNARGRRRDPKFKAVQILHDAGLGHTKIARYLVRVGLDSPSKSRDDAEVASVGRIAKRLRRAREGTKIARK